MLPGRRAALGLLARRMGCSVAPAAAARASRPITAGSRSGYTGPSATSSAPGRGGGRLPRVPSFTALKATGFTDPDRARENLRLILEGRPLVPYAASVRDALRRMFPVLLDALWKSPDPDQALHQLERFVAAAGPRTAFLELLAGAPSS